MVFIDTNMCEMAGVLKIIKFVSELIDIVCFLIPMVLIVMLAIDFGKAMISNDDNQMKKAKAIAIRRVIMCICIFLVPTVVRVSLSLVEGATTSALGNYDTCIENMGNLSFYEELEKTRNASREKENDDLAKKYQSSLVKSQANRTIIAYDSGSSSNLPDSEGIFHGQTYQLSIQQLRKLAAVCICENGTKEAAVKAESSLMANLYELKGKKNYSSVYDYVLRSPWFSCKTANPKTATKETIAYVKSVLVNGNRTLPLFIDEHVGTSGISYVENFGKKFNKKDRSQYRKGVTIIHQTKSVGGGKWTFYTFPTSKSDPFGYTDSSFKKIKGNK